MGMEMARRDTRRLCSSADALSAEVLLNTQAVALYAIIADLQNAGKL